MTTQKKTDRSHNMKTRNNCVWIRILLEKLTVADLNKKHATFLYEIQSFIAVCTRSTLSRINSSPILLLQDLFQYYSPFSFAQVTVLCKVPYVVKFLTLCCLFKVLE